MLIKAQEKEAFTREDAIVDELEQK